MNFDFDTLDKNIASAASNIVEEAEEEFWYHYNNREPQKEAVFVTREELSSIVREMVFEILEPIKNHINKIVKKVNILSENVDILSENVDDLKQDLDGLKVKMDKIYEPTIKERKAAAGARLNSDYYNKLEEEANNAIPEGDE